MGTLFVVSTEDSRFAAQAAAGARQVFARQGLTGLCELNCPGWRVLHGGYAVAGPDLRLDRADGFAAVAGALSVEGRQGRPALARLMDRAGPPRFDEEELAGQFAALVSRAGRYLLFGDWFGTLPIYHDERRRFFSTSLLGAIAALPRCSLKAQAVYEYAFNIVPIGNDTVIDGLSLLAPGEVV